MKLIKVKNVQITITGQVGSGKSQVLNVIKENLMELGATIDPIAEHIIVVNFETTETIKSCPAR